MFFNSLLHSKKLNFFCFPWFLWNVLLVRVWLSEKSESQQAFVELWICKRLMDTTLDRFICRGSWKCMILPAVYFRFFLFFYSDLITLVKLYRMCIYDCHSACVGAFDNRGLHNSTLSSWTFYYKKRCRQKFTLIVQSPILTLIN